MLNDGSGYGTLIIAALLVLALVFAASWIALYVQPGRDPSVLFPWFGGAAAFIVVLGLLVYLRGRRGTTSR